jgi:hypothetical protein
VRRLAWAAADAVHQTPAPGRSWAETTGAGTAIPMRARKNTARGMEMFRGSAARIG